MKIIDRLVTRVRIDWLGFAVTRGGFFDLMGPMTYHRWPKGRPPQMLIASGGVVPPVIAPKAASGWQMAAYAYMQPGWHQWREWFCMPSWADMLPVFRAPRGGIVFVTPPSLS